MLVQQLRRFSLTEALKNEFSLNMGLRQRDPLSPFLLLIVVESLNVLMTATTEANMFTGYSVSSNNPTVISHL